MKLLNDLTCFPDANKKPGYHPGSVEIVGKNKLINKKITLKNVNNNYLITGDDFSVAILTKEKEIRVKRSKNKKKERRYKEFNFNEDDLISFIFKDKFKLSDFESYFNLDPILITKPNLVYQVAHQFNDSIRFMNGPNQVGYIFSMPCMVGLMYDYKLNNRLTVLLSENTEVSIKYVKDNSWITETRNYDRIDQFPVELLLNLRSDFYFRDVELLLNLRQL